MQLLQSLASVQERVASTRSTVFWLDLAALALTGLAAWLFTGLALRPLGRLQAGAARVTGAQDLATPLPDDGPEEVHALASALNAMLGRLQASTATMDRALQSTRRFAADAGHELRTPLTGLRANLDALERNPDLPADQRQALVRDTIAEQERILHLLEGLQALTRGDAADRIPREEVELDELLDAAVYGARRRHPGVEYELDVRAEGAALEGWGGGLRLLADNLLDNAALHGGPRVRGPSGAGRRRWSCGSRTTGRGSRPQSARACSSRSPAASARARPARGSAWRSSPSRSRCTAASCSSATRRSAVWRWRSGSRRRISVLLTLCAFRRPATAEHVRERVELVGALPLVVGHAAGADRAHLGEAQRLTLLREMLEQVDPVTLRGGVDPVEMIVERVHGFPSKQFGKHRVNLESHSGGGPDLRDQLGGLRRADRPHGRPRRLHAARRRL